MTLEHGTLESGIQAKHQISPCGFSRIWFSKERVRSWIIVNFNIIISYIFPENFIEIHQVFQKISRYFSSVVAIFWHFFGFFNIFLLQKN